MGAVMIASNICNIDLCSDVYSTISFKVNMFT